jgi:DnaK suppressor protein
MLLAQKQELLSKTKEVSQIELDHQGDEVDQIQAKIIASLNLELIKRNAAKITQIDEALLRIEKKTFGSCQDCLDSIPEKRLLLNPHFQTCVDCAEERENEEKKRKRLAL